MTDHGTGGSSPPVALAIAGVDPGGGAGILADVSTFAALGVHAAAVVTALTAQGGQGVSHVHITPLDTVVAQLEAVLSSLPLAAVKVGMLGDAPTTGAVAERAAAARLPHLVVDPEMSATLGGRLIDDDGTAALRDLLVPQAEVLTPNRYEAGVLLGRPLTSDADAEDAAAALARLEQLGYVTCSTVGIYSRTLLSV
ncbi:MAG: hydroxymethylpyrimidine/phosphomethylpyrimidine kinase [Solirubrobacterales bacterium]|nr:hydroxymethylpyrimidine/phosphomethylpyrimidine kinase [Solirubrobacterales bacterium]